MRTYRRGARFIADVRAHCRPLNRNQIAKIMALAEALELRTRPKGGKRGVLGQGGLRVLRAMLRGFLRRSDGLCCPSVEAIREKTGMARSHIFKALARLEACGILKRTQRLVRRTVRGVLTTVQASNLYAFFEPLAHAHLLPVEKAPGRTARLLLKVIGSLSMGTGSSIKPGIHLKEKKKSWQGENVTGATA